MLQPLTIDIDVCLRYVWSENSFFMRVPPLLLLLGKSYQAHAIVSVCVFFDMLDSETTHFTRQMRTLWLVLKRGGSVWEIRLGFRVRAGLSSRPSSFATVKSWFLSHLHHIYISVLVFCRLIYGAGDDPGRFSCADLVWVFLNGNAVLYAGSAQQNGAGVWRSALLLL